MGKTSGHADGKFLPEEAGSTRVFLGDADGK